MKNHGNLLVLLVFAIFCYVFQVFSTAHIHSDSPNETYDPELPPCQVLFAFLGNAQQVWPLECNRAPNFCGKSYTGLRRLKTMLIKNISGRYMF